MTLGRRIAINAMTALGSQLLLTILGLAATAVLLRQLGAPRFGGWSLIMAVVAYGNLLDLGLGVSLVRRGAVLHASGDRAGLERALGATLAATTLLGLMALGLVSLLAQPLADWMRVEEAWRGEFVTALRISGAAIAIMLAGVPLGAVGAALQRLDAVVRLETSVTALTLAAQSAAALAGSGLAELAVLGVAGRGGSLAGRVWLARRLLGPFRLRLDPRYSFWSELGRFGALKLAHQVLSQLVLHVDRFLVGAMVSVRAVAEYTVAVELAQRLLMVQLNVAPAFYPAASAAGSGTDRATLESLYQRTSRAVALLTYPLAATLIVMAQPLLAVWVGVEFGETSADLLRVLAVAYAVMALTAIPSTAADALNRPGISVRYSLTGFLIHLAIALPLIPRMGVMGAGLATLGNVGLQSPFFIRAVTRGIVRVPPGAYLRRVVGEPLAPAAMVAAVLGASLAVGLAGRADGLAISLLLAAAAFAVALRAFGVLDAEERAFVKGLPGGRLLAWVVGR